MSIQWTLIAGCMYSELAVTIVLLIPVISPKRWHSFFKSRFLASIANMSHIYFRIFLAVLGLCFLDAIREMRKYSGDLKDHSHGSSDHAQHLDVEMQQHMRLFRAQRNFYISGFSLFLWVVLQRLMTLISTLAVSQAETEAAMRQAKSASDAAKQLLDQQSAEGGSASDTKQTEKELQELREQNKKIKAEQEAALKQAESVSREYDRLMKELATVQAKQEQGDKKDD